MTEYFTNLEYQKARKQKLNLLIGYLVSAVVFTAFVVGVIIYYARLPYQSPKIPTVKWIAYPITALFVIFSFLYLGIPFKRAKRYATFCHNLVYGLKEETTAEFFEYQDVLQEKDGVDCKALVFLEWNKYKKDYFERKVLVFYDKPFIEIPSKARVKFITQGNFLISYEIIETEE